jgi:FKBP-type peptidyl-prolyl cis-trans isomerase (trigger factor)
MKSQIKEVDETTVKVLFEISHDKMKPIVDDVYKKVTPNVKASGFRKGKVPRQIVNAKVGNDYIVEEITNAAVGKFYSECISESSLKVVSQADINVLKPYDSTETGDSESSFKFEVLVEVRPKVDLQPIEGVDLKVEVKDVEDEDVDSTIKRIYQVRLAESSNFDNTGVSKVPDDEFAKDFGFKDLAALKESVRISLVETAKVDAIKKSLAEFMNELVNKLNIKIPQKLLHDQMDFQIKQKEKTNGKPVKKEERDKLQADTEAQIADRFYLEEYADSIHITVSNEELIEYLTSLAREFQIPVEQFVYQSFSDSGTISFARSEVIKRKATEDILSKMHVIDQNGNELDLPFKKNKDKQTKKSSKQNNTKEEQK